MSDDLLIEIKTVQCGSIRTLIEALKETLTDTVIFCDEAGLKIKCMDGNHIVLVYLKLDAEKFEYYKVNGSHELGVNMNNFFKIIKTMNNNDTLTLFLEKDNKCSLGIKIENGEKNSRTVYHLNLLDLEPDKVDIPKADFDYIITWPSQDFQKICRDMTNLQIDDVEISCVGQKLIFSCKGDFASQTTTIGENNSNLSFIEADDPEQVFHGRYTLKYLVQFTKCTNLCPSIELFMKNDYPLIIKYTVASLGEIRLCLCPNTNDDD